MFCLAATTSCPPTDGERTPTGRENGCNRVAFLLSVLDAFCFYWLAGRFGDHAFGFFVKTAVHAIFMLATCEKLVRRLLAGRNARGRLSRKWPSVLKAVMFCLPSAPCDLCLFCLLMCCRTATVERPVGRKKCTSPCRSAVGTRFQAYRLVIAFCSLRCSPVLLLNVILNHHFRSDVGPEEMYEHVSVGSGDAFSRMSTLACLLLLAMFASFAC